MGERGAGNTLSDRREKRGKRSGGGIGSGKIKSGMTAKYIINAIKGKPSAGPVGGTSVGTEGYDSTKATTAADPSSNPQVGESIMNGGGTGANETYDYSKGSKAVSSSTPSTSKKRKSSLKVNISDAGGTGRNIV